MPSLRANPSQRRQIGNHSPWIFWRDHPSGRGRQGFACCVLVCSTPDCPCTAVSFVGLFVDDRLRSATSQSHQLSFRWDAEAEATATAGNPLVGASCAVTVDHATRQVTGEKGPTEALDQLLPWLLTEIDDDLVATLQHNIAKQKLANRAQADLHDPWEGWEPGDLVSHSEAFPESDWAPFQWRDTSWLASDLHCVEPRCDCTDIRFVFSRADDGAGASNAAYAGTLLVTLPSLEPQDLDVEGGQLENLSELRELWNTFSSQDPDLQNQLTARRARVKTLRPPNTTVMRGPKVGRNDPCPCGSGKKSKKCCGR